MQHPILSNIQRRTHDEAAAQCTHVLRAAQQFSLRELINSRLQHPLWPINSRAVDVAQELSEGCRQRTGEAPTGIWVPLGALSRDLTASGTGAATTGIIGNKLQAALEPQSAVMGGATVLSGLTGNQFALPAIDSPIDAGGTWLAEGDIAAQKEPTFKSQVLTPKSMIFTLNVSRRLMGNASADLETALRSEILRRVMLEIDRAALAGAGGNEPSGLLSDAGLQVLNAGANGLAPTWAHLVEAEYQISTRVGAMQAPAFLTSPAIRKKLRTTQRAAGLDFIVSTDADKVMGQPLRISPLVPDNLTKGTSAGVCSALVFGDLAEIFVGFWGPLAVDLLIDGTTQARDGRIRIVARAEVGVAVRNIDAFVAYKDLLSA